MSIPSETSLASDIEPDHYQSDAALTICCDSRNIAAKFIAHAIRSPEAVAIVEDHHCFTYGSLLQRAQALALRLRSEHAPGTVIAIHAQRNSDTPLAMIACLLANLSFVVIDAAYVAQRILDILALARVETVLHGDLSDELGERITALGIRTLHIRHENNSPAVELMAGAQETAYLLFTSGSTGFPKGIRTGHAPLIHFIEWYRRKFQPGPGARFSMLSGLSHDPLFRDIFVPLSTGGQLHIPRQSDILVPDRLFAWMRASAIEFTHLTPQLVDVLHARRDRGLALERLRYVFCGGDVLRPETVRQVENAAPQATLVNFYGTSETPQAMAFQVIEREMAAPYPLGQPIADVEIEIVNEDRYPLPAGEQGEIAIVTEYLSDGYIANAATESGKISRQPYVSRPGASADGSARKMYLTGDLGYKDRHGRIFFSGRADDQIKVRGYRVDCAEVAANIERHQLARKVVVLPERTQSGDAALLAFVVGDAAHVDRLLPTLVPAHMVPRAVIAIADIPLLPNGKINRAALYELRRASLEKARTPQPHHHSAFFQAIAEAMNVPALDPDKSFLDMGGDSLSFIRIGLIIEDHVGALPEAWEAMPFSALAALDRDKRARKIKTRQIEPSILLRAIAIVLVVLVHAKLGFYVVATSTLFVVAGMSFSRFLLPGLLNGRGLAPTARFILKYGVPAGLWQALSGLHQGQFWLPDVLLFGALWANPAQHLTFWFLDILTVSIVCMAALAALAGTHRYRIKAVWAADRSFHFCLAVLAFAIVAFFLQTQFDRWNGEVGISSVGPFRWLWLVALGAAIQTARHGIDRALLTGVALLLASLCYANLVTKGAFQEPFSLFLLGSIAALIWVRHIPIPAISYQPILILAQHSLFIYLFSLWVPNSLLPKLQQLGLPDWAPLAIPLTLAVGIGMSLLWNRFLRLASIQLNKIAPGRAQR